MLNTNSAQNTLYATVRLKKNLSAQFFVVTADIHNNFNARNALYYATLSDTATSGQLADAIAKLQ